MSYISEDKVKSIINKAKSIGFDQIGFATLEDFNKEDSDRLVSWLDCGMNADLHYMQNNVDKRLSIPKLVDSATCAIVLLTNYYPDVNSGHSDSPKVASYAYGKDYHYVLKDMMQTLYDFIKEGIYPNIEGRCFVDSAPVLERSLAQRAGLGWIGKSTSLINPKLGSYCFISEIICNLSVDINTKQIPNGCGACQRCVSKCPTKAIGEKGVDARKCISYLTIENKGDIPLDFKGKMENCVFGCDICLQVCPWNKKAKPHNIKELMPNEYLLNLSNSDWKNMTVEQYTEWFRKSPVKRAKYQGLRRNIDFLFDNSGDN